MHPEYQSRLAHGWVRRGEHLAVRRGKGRRRVNLAGALCLETGHCQIVEDVRITAETTVELFARLERANPDKRRIHVILDNAGTNRGQPLREWLARSDCRIRPIYLPPYAPNLNAIERLWKVMHQHVTRNRHYEDFRAFAEAIMRFFKTTLPQGWEPSVTPSATTSTSSVPRIFGSSGRLGITGARGVQADRCHGRAPHRRAKTYA